MTATAWPFIEIDDSGVAYVMGTRTKVIEIALDRIAHHWDADEIQRQHPHLSLGRIHAALSYYYENQEDCDRLIESEFQASEEILRRRVNPSLVAKLRRHAEK